MDYKKMNQFMNVGSSDNIDLEYYEIYNKYMRRIDTFKKN